MRIRVLRVSDGNSVLFLSRINSSVFTFFVYRIYCLLRIECSSATRRRSGRFKTNRRIVLSRSPTTPSARQTSLFPKQSHPTRPRPRRTGRYFYVFESVRVYFTIMMTTIAPLRNRYAIGFPRSTAAATISQSHWNRHGTGASPVSSGTFKGACKLGDLHVHTGCTRETRAKQNETADKTRPPRQGLRPTFLKSVSVRRFR